VGSLPITLCSPAGKDVVCLDRPCIGVERHFDRCIIPKFYLGRQPKPTLGHVVTLLNRQGEEGSDLWRTGEKLLSVCRRLTPAPFKIAHRRKARAVQFVPLA
jgi:hypothetical protein